MTYALAYRSPSARPSYSVSAGPAALDTQFPGALEIWSLTKEVSGYGGPAIRARRVDNGSEADVGFSGKQLDLAALATHLFGTTGIVATVYGQKGVTNLTQGTVGNMPAILVDTDGRPTIRHASTDRLETASTTVKTADIHCFMVGKHAYAPGPGPDPEACYLTYGGVGSYTSNRWGFGLDSSANLRLNVVQNGVNDTNEFRFGNAHMGGFFVWDYLANTKSLRHSGTEIGFETISANITYPSTQTLYVGNDGSGTRPLLGGWRCLALYGTAQASRSAIVSYLENAHACPPLPATFDDGYAIFAPDYFPSFSFFPADANSMVYHRHHGGYPWSAARAINVRNNVPLYRFEVRVGDDDTFITGNERAEFSGGHQTLGTLLKPGHGCLCGAFMVKSGSPMQDGEWCSIAQWHYGDQTLAPCIFVIHILNEEILIEVQRVGSPGGVSAASTPIPLERDVWYFWIAENDWSANSTADTAEAWLGKHGTVLSKVINASGALFENGETEAYIKLGVYRGAANEGSLVVYEANKQYSETPNTFDAFITSQPPLPTFW